MNKKSFTLVELLIVILIIGILSAVIAPRMAAMDRKAKEAATKRNLEALRAAIRFYQADHDGRLPFNGLPLQILENGTTPSLSNNDLVPLYIPKIPKVYLGQKETWGKTSLQYHEGDNSFFIFPASAWPNSPDRRTCAGGFGGSLGEWFYCSDTGEIWINAANDLFTGYLTDTNGQEIRWW